MGTGWAAGGAQGGRRRLGEVLVAGKVLTEAQLEEALRVQCEDKGRRRRLGEVITALYAGLATVIRPDIDVVTLEVPVEYQVAGSTRSRSTSGSA
jgi:hypothetical protein